MSLIDISTLLHSMITISNALACNSEFSCHHIQVLSSSPNSLTFNEQHILQAQWYLVHFSELKEGWHSTDLVFIRATLLRKNEFLAMGMGPTQAKIHLHIQLWLSNTGHSAERTIYSLKTTVSWDYWLSSSKRKPEKCSVCLDNLVLYNLVYIFLVFLVISWYFWK